MHLFSKSGICIFSIVSVVCGLSCQREMGVNGPPIRNLSYAWGYFNTTKTNLDDVQISYPWRTQTMKSGAGFLPPCGPHDLGKRESIGFDPIPETVTVTWKTADGERHRQEARVASAIPDLAHFSGTVYFIFVNDGTVKVVPITHDEQERRVSAQLPPVPTNGLNPPH